MGGDNSSKHGASTGPISPELKEHLGVAKRKFISRLAPFGLQVLVSAATYTTGLGVVQVVGSTLRISCATPALSSIMGFVGVGAASAFSGHMTRHIERQLSEGKNPLQAIAQPFWKDGVVLEEVVFDMIVGLTAFKLWQGQYRRLMPSDLRKPGAFGFQSVPLGKSDYASPVQKGQLVSIFKRDGCHHCGKTSIRAAKVVGDHIPPTKLVVDAKAAAQAATESQRQIAELFKHVQTWMGESGTKQRYYAQCAKCSSRQGGLLSKESRGSYMVMHRFWRLQPWSIPGIVVGFRQPAMVLSPSQGGGGQRPCRDRGSSPGAEGSGKQSRPGIWSWIRRIDDHGSQGKQESLSTAVEELLTQQAAGAPKTLQAGAA